MKGQGAGNTIIENANAGATMLSYSQSGMSDKERRNWMLLEDFTIRDEATKTGIGLSFNGVLCVAMKNVYIRDFSINQGMVVQDTLWFFAKNLNTDLCEIRMFSNSVPHLNNAIAFDGGT